MDTKISKKFLAIIMVHVMFMMSFTNVNAVRYETATPTALT